MTSQTVERWPGNLPCCHGPKDGCDAHNSGRVPIFWNPSLPSTVRPVTGGLFQALFRATKTDRDECQEAPLPTPTITSTLSRDAFTCTPLPLVHPSVPYTLSFYHVFAVMSLAATGHDPQPLTSALTCRGIHGLRPQITWSVTPKVVDGRFFIAHAYAFSIGVEHLPQSKTRGYYSKNWLVSRGFKSFAPCTHCTRVFRTMREKVDSRGVRFLKVAYSLRNVLGQEFRDEWRSEVGRQPNNMSCGMCYTDFSMSFEEEPGQSSIRVRLWSHKDLGCDGTSQVPDERWNAAAGSAFQRPTSDFGTIRRAFQLPAGAYRSTG